MRVDPGPGRRDRPILRCPDDPIEVSQAESVRIDLGTLCHVWTADPAQVADLAWSAELSEDSQAGLTAGPRRRAA